MTTDTWADAAVTWADAAVTWADAAVRDEGRGLRRAGGALMVGGGLLSLSGFTTLTLAYVTYSGYRVQAVLGLAIGAALLGVGWSVLRRGDRLGPALVMFPRGSFAPAVAPPPVPTPTPRPARIRVQLLPFGELPPAS